MSDLDEVISEAVVNEDVPFSSAWWATPKASSGRAPRVSAARGSHLSEKGLESMLANQIGDIPIPLLKTATPAITADCELFPGKRKSHSMAPVMNNWATSWNSTAR